MLILLQGEAVNVTRGQARPGEDSSDGPTLVWVNLFVRSFEKIDDVRMQFSVQITFRQQWNDNRSLEIQSVNDPSVFTITEKTPTRAFSAFTFRHFLQQKRRW